MIKRLAILCVLIALVGCAGQAPPTYTPQPTYTPAPTYTPERAETNTPEPTNTPPPTKPPEPAATTAPDEGSTNADPVSYTGSGSTMLAVQKPYVLSIVHVVGNAAGQPFQVTSYDGERKLDVLVKATAPYDGYVSLDLQDDENTNQLEIMAEGEWAIELLPIGAPILKDHGIKVPGAFGGRGDNVLFLYGGTPSKAQVSNEAEGGVFVVITHGSTSHLLVNEMGSYAGTVDVAADAIMVEVRSSGVWKIEVE